MNCYAVFDLKTNKQIRVFAYEILRQGDYKRAEKLAFDMAHGMHKGGYPCVQADTLRHMIESERIEDRAEARRLIALGRAEARLLG